MSGRSKQTSNEDLDSRAEELAEEVRGKKKPKDDEKPLPRTSGGNPDEQVIELDEEDEDEKDDDSEEERPSRAQRRRERGLLRKENDELRERLARLEGQATALQQRPVVVQQPQQQTQEDPDAQAMRAVIERTQALATRGQQLSSRKDAAGNVIGMTPEERAKYEQDWEALEQEKTDIMVRRAQRKLGGGQPGMTQQDVARAMLVSEFPEVFADPKLVAYAHTRTQQMIAFEGKPNDMSTVRAALLETKNKMNPPKRPAPTPERKSRYEGVSRSGGGSDDDARPRTVTLTAQQQRMAEARWKNLPAKEAHKRFAREVVLKRKSA